MTRVTCRLTAKNRDQLGNPTLGNREWATFTFYQVRPERTRLDVCVLKQTCLMTFFSPDGIAAHLRRSHLAVVVVNECFRCTSYTSTNHTTMLALPLTKLEVSRFSAYSSRYSYCYYQPASPACRAQMRPIATDVAWSVRVCLSVCWVRRNRLNR